MSQPPTGPEGHPPAYPPQPPGAPGQQQPAGGTVYGNPYGSRPPAPQQHVPGPHVPGQHVPGQPGPGQPGPEGAGPPQSGPPVQYPPMSAPPVQYPPMSAPPVSGPAFGQPMSAPPGAVPPYGAPASAPAGRGRTVLILAVVAGLLFVLGGVMTGLFVSRGGELDRTERKLAAEVSEGEVKAGEIDKLKVELQTMKDKLADTEQDLTGTRNDRDEQARQKKVIATCLDKLTTALAAASAGNKAAFDKASKGLDKVCNEAEDYL